jgi:hypothetical protein
MTPRTRTRWRKAVSTGGVCLAVIALAATVWYRATYHVFPGMMPSVVHWCGRDYQEGVSGPQSWAQITTQAPVAVRAVGSYPPFGPGRLLLADTGATTHRSPGQVCAMTVYVRTGAGRYQAYTLEGGP